MKTLSRIKIAVSAVMSALLITSFAGTASAAILFQDDTFDEVESDAIMIGSNDAGAVNTAIQFGADSTATENAQIEWDISTNTLNISDVAGTTTGTTFDINLLGGLTAAYGNVDLSGATQTRLREDTDPNTNAACTTLGEVIVNTTSNVVMICTATGTPGTWVGASATDADTLDSLDSTQFLRADDDSSLTAGSVLTILGSIDASGGTVNLPSGTSTPATCTIGDIFYETDTFVMYVCTATDTWSTVNPQDFEDVYTNDADSTLTTSNGNFTIATGTGTMDVTSTNTTATAIELTASTGAGGITASAGTGGLNFGSTGLFAISGAANSTITTTGTSDITVTAGDDLLFDDAQLTAAIQLTNTATGWATTLTAGGLIDNINSFTLTTAGEGASNVGLEASSLTNVTPASNDVQAALEALDAEVGAGAPNVEILNFYPEYPDTVIYRDGSSNLGTLVADYDNTNSQHYYRWTSNQITLQDIELRFRFPMPADFASVGDFTGAYRTGTTTTTNNTVDFTVTDVTDAATCGTSTSNSSANAWATATITAATLNSGCAGLGAGDLMQVIVKLYDLTGASTFADAGVVNLVYNN